MGPSIGVGGFGEIYLASNEIEHPVQPDAKYVIKIVIGKILEPQLSFITEPSFCSRNLIQMGPFSLKCTFTIELRKGMMVSYIAKYFRNIFILTGLFLIAVKQWIKDHKLDYLGMPRFYGSGSHQHKDTKFRFMVMDRYSEDLQKILDRNNRLFSIKNVFVLGIRIVRVKKILVSL